MTERPITLLREPWRGNSSHTSSSIALYDRNFRALVCHVLTYPDPAGYRDVETRDRDFTRF